MNYIKRASAIAATFVLMLSFSITTSFAQTKDTTNTDSTTNTTYNTASSGYTLSGTVVDGGTSKAISGATVKVVGTSDSTTTDKTGSFKLSDISKGSQTVKVKADGYQSWKKDVMLSKDMKKYKIKLQEE